MRICVIPGLYFKTFSRFTEPRIPFEALALCGVVGSVPGCVYDLVDFNIKGDHAKVKDNGVRFPGLPLDARFYEEGAQALAATGATGFLFSISIHTNGNLYHAVKLAEHIRGLAPAALIVFVGLGPSSRHLDLLAAYPCIDAVARGEAEATVADLLARFPEDAASPEARASVLAGVAGLTYRGAEGKIAANPDRPLIEDLDALPLPALHLYGDIIRRVSSETDDVKYLSVEEHIHVEAGRGCPFTCTFCSNEYLWRRRYRLKSPARLVEEIRICAEHFGGKKFLLHQQLFTANKAKTLAFCEMLQRSGLDIEWSCFTRNDCVDSELLTAMKDSGCNTVLYGIESGSQRIQDLAHKKMKLDEVTEQIALTIAHGIKPQLSYIIGFPDERPDDLQQTLDMYFRYKFEEDVESQIGLLAPAGGTQILDRNVGELAFDGVSTTTWYTRFFQQESYSEMQRRSLVFPQNHYIKTPHVPRALLKFVKAFDIAASYLTRSLRYVVLQRLASVPFEAYELYRGFRARPAAELRAKCWDGDLRWDTDLSSIVVEFAQFIDEVLAPRDDDASLLRSLVRFELNLALVNMRLRERNYDALCTATPETTNDNFVSDPEAATEFDSDYLIEDVFAYCDGVRRGTARPAKHPTRYRVRASDASHLEIEESRREGTRVHRQPVFRQIEF